MRHLLLVLALAACSPAGSAGPARSDPGGRDADGPDRHFALPYPLEAAVVAVDPRGAAVVYVEYRERQEAAILLDLDTGERRALTRDPVPGERRFQFGGDVVARLGDTLRIWSVASGEEVAVDPEYETASFRFLGNTSSAVWLRHDASLHGYVNGEVVGLGRTGGHLAESQGTIAFSRDDDVFLQDVLAGTPPVALRIGPVHELWFPGDGGALAASLAKVYAPVMVVHLTSQARHQVGGEVFYALDVRGTTAASLEFRSGSGMQLQLVELVTGGIWAVPLVPQPGVGTVHLQTAGIWAVVPGQLPDTTRFTAYDARHGTHVGVDLAGYCGYDNAAIGADQLLAWSCGKDQNRLARLDFATGEVTWLGDGIIERLLDTRGGGHLFRTEKGELRRVGPAGEVTTVLREVTDAPQMDARGRVVVPALVDGMPWIVRIDPDSDSPAELLVQTPEPPRRFALHGVIATYVAYDRTWIARVRD